MRSILRRMRAFSEGDTEMGWSTFWRRTAALSLCARLAGESIVSLGGRFSMVSRFCFVSGSIVKME